MATPCGNAAAPKLGILAAAGTVPLMLLILGAWDKSFVLLLCRWPNARGIVLMKIKSTATKVALQAR